MTDELKAARALLREFVECDAIQNYDSTVCWGCGELRGSDDSAECVTNCLLNRARKFLAQ